MPTIDYFYGLIQTELTLTEDQKSEIFGKYPVPVLSNKSEGFSLEDQSHGSGFIEETLLLVDFSIEKTQGAQPRPYLKLRFSNHLGSYSAKIWDNDGAIDRYQPLLESYSVFKVSGKVEEFRGFKSMTINQLIPCDNNVDAFSLIACTQQSLEDFTLELFQYINEIEEPFKSICIGAMNRFWTEFCVRPAAMGHHHAYLGGLLKHTVGLMRLARYIVKQEENHYKAVIKLINQVEKAYKQELWKDLQSDSAGSNPRNLVWKDSIDHLYTMFYGMAKYKLNKPNYSLMICAILYHDMGKLLEYHHAGKGTEEFKFLYPTADHSSLETRKPSGITMDELGVLIGHIPYGVMLVNKIIEAEEVKLSIEDIHSLQHTILAHHGKLEWGANIEPKTVEGFLIHIVDYLDSRYERTEEIK
ncbi:HD domain-containing protein [Bacillus sp. PS06]|uniref:HD domain-containing protein n=1 Tax=Bacillus sp. PS06 TaxID=2764176 RepID=UPI00177DB931|nr:HD domain-containing protein [Bacillus sp. PS06]MBD8068519.1 HD domain-containing protein [Bacillus sp. PS06]